MPDISWHLPQRCLQTLPNAPGWGPGGAKSPLVEGHGCGQLYPSSGLFPISSHAHTISRSHRPWLCSLPWPAQGSSQWDSGQPIPAPPSLKVHSKGRSGLALCHAQWVPSCTRQRPPLPHLSSRFSFVHPKKPRSGRCPLPWQLRSSAHPASVF